MTDSRDKTRYTGPDAIAAESVYDAGYEDCEKVLNPIIAELKAEIERLKGDMRDIYEVWASSEGVFNSTHTEKYLSGLIKQMADIAVTAKGNE